MLPTSRRARVIGAIPLVAALAVTIGISTTGRAAQGDSAPAPIRINSGGAAAVDDDGNAWVADTSYVGGKVGSTTTAVAGTRKQDVFRDERYGMSAYRIPVTNGTYEVRLLESEHYFDAAGKRIFSVTAEGRTVLANIDVFARAGGKFTALWLPFTVTVTDGRLDLGFTAARNYAKVDGIAVLWKSAPSSATASPTPSPTATATAAPTGNSPNDTAGAPSGATTSPTPAPDETTAAPAPAPAATPAAAHGSGVLWGMNDNPDYDGFESSLGRPFALAREYRRIDQSFVSSRMQQLVNSGHSLVVSARARTASAAIPYSAIAAGQYDDALVTGLTALNGLATPTYFIFQHEADSTSAKDSCTDKSDAGCGPQFVAAWRHIYQLAKARGLNRVIFTWTVTAYGFSPQTDVRNTYYWPGAAYTDWIGVDAYNGGCEQTWYGTFDETVARSVDWVRANAPGKPMMLPEWGATEGSTADAKANFFAAVPTALSDPKNAVIRAVLYWHSQESGCDFRITSSQAAYDAFRRSGLNQRVSAMPARQE